MRRRHSSRIVDNRPVDRNSMYFYLYAQAPKHSRFERILSPGAKSAPLCIHLEIRLRYEFITPFCTRVSPKPAAELFLITVLRFALQYDITLYNIYYSRIIAGHVGFTDDGDPHLFVYVFS